MNEYNIRKTRLVLQIINMLSQTIYMPVLLSKLCACYAEKCLTKGI